MGKKWPNGQSEVEHFIYYRGSCEQEVLSEIICHPRLLVAYGQDWLKKQIDTPSPQVPGVVSSSVQIPLKEQGICLGHPF